MTTPYEMQSRPAIFQQVVGQVDPTYAQQVHDMDQTFDQNWESNAYILANYTQLKTEYQALTAFLDTNMTQIQSAYPTRPLFPLVVRQAAWGMSAFLDELSDQAKDPNNANDPDANAARDAGMATNMELLIDNLYAGKKVMVWAHNVHIMHDLLSYNNIYQWKNTGNWIFEKYGQRVYTVGLYMYQGSAANDTRAIYTIPPASAVSVEGLLHTAGDPYVFLDLSNLSGSNDETAWMYEDYPIREWGTVQGLMTVTGEYDGLLQIDTVRPPTYIPFQ